MTRHPNWIGGAPCDPARGAWFSRRGPGPRGAALGEWAQSGAPDVERALLALAEARPASLAELREAFERLAASPDPQGLSAAAWDLEPHDLEEYVAPLTESLDDLVDQDWRGRRSSSGPEGAARGPIVALRAHWSAGPLVFWTRVLRLLARGQRVLMLPDPSLAPAAQALARCLAEVGGDASEEDHPWGLLFADGEAPMQALASGPEKVELRFVGPAPAKEQLQLVLRQGLRESAARSLRPFGFGLGRGDDLVLGRPIALGIARVEEAEDPVAAARRVARLAFGPDWALGGWDAGALRRVQVAPRALSGFTEALLEELEQHGACDPAPWPPHKRLQDHLLEARRTGLGEGATLIHEGLRSSRGLPGSAILTRLVFTNVESGMGLVALQAPAPVLLLERAEAPNR